MEVVRAYSPYREKTLHLSMDPRPYDVKEQSSTDWKRAKNELE
jgi:2-dehydro-3-deoxyphosphogalactonate aldolase